MAPRKKVTKKAKKEATQFIKMLAGEGVKSEEIANELNKMGYITPHGKPFSRETVNYHRRAAGMRLRRHRSDRVVASKAKRVSVNSGRVANKSSNAHWMKSIVRDLVRDNSVSAKRVATIIRELAV